MINVAYYKQDGQTTKLCPSCLKDVVNVVFDGWLYSSITFLIKCWRWLAISNQIKNNSCMVLESSFSRSRAVINERCSYCHTWEDSYHVVYTSQDTGINCLCWFSYFQGMNKRWHTHRLVLDVQNFLWELSLPNKKMEGS